MTTPTHGHQTLPAALPDALLDHLLLVVADLGSAGVGAAQLTTAPGHLHPDHAHDAVEVLVEVFARRAAVPPVPNTGTLRGDLTALFAPWTQPLSTAERAAARLLADASHDPVAHAVLDAAVVTPLGTAVATIQQRSARRCGGPGTAQRHLVRSLVQALWWDRYLTRPSAHPAAEVEQLVQYVLLPLMHPGPDDRDRSTAAGSSPVRPGTAHRTEEAGPVGPATLRRAVAYIEANPHQPITSAQIAAAAGTSARALQYAFRRHHGTTPLSYVRQVRLQRAHQDLQAADPAEGATVAVIAARWGFRAPARFAAAYRGTFGVPPRTTLHS